MQLNATKHEEVDRLLEHLIRGPTWRFHALLRACALTDQGHVVRTLGFDPDVYLEGQQEPGGPLSSNRIDSVVAGARNGFTSGFTASNAQVSHQTCKVSQRNYSHTFNSSFPVSSYRKFSLEFKDYQKKLFPCC